MLVHPAPRRHRERRHRRRRRTAGASAPRRATLDATYAELIAGCAPVAAPARGCAPGGAGAGDPRLLVLRASASTTAPALLAGDAACFIDPVFSTGVHLACLSGLLAADCLEDVLAGRRTRRVRVPGLRRRAIATPSSAIAASSSISTTTTARPTRTSGRRGSSSIPTGRSSSARRSCGSSPGTSDIPPDASAIEQVDARWRASLEKSRPDMAPGIHLIAGRDDARRDAQVRSQLGLSRGAGGWVHRRRSGGASSARRSSGRGRAATYARSLATARIEEPEDFAKLPVTRKQDVAGRRGVRSARGAAGARVALSRVERDDRAAGVDVVRARRASGRWRRSSTRLGAGARAPTMRCC